MDKHEIDPEQVAALIDGRLAPHDRAILLAKLADDPDWRDVLVDAASVRDEDVSTAQITQADVAPLEVAVRGTERRRVGRRLLPWLTLAAAASVAVAVFRQPSPSSANDAQWRVPRSAGQPAVAPDELQTLTEDRWRVVRSSAISLSPRARAVRLGALAADATIGGSEAGANARTEIMTLLQQVNGSGPAIALIRSASDSTTLALALTAVRALAQTDAFDAGVWLELVRAGQTESALAAEQMRSLREFASNLDVAPERAAELTTRLNGMEQALAAGDLVKQREEAGTLLRLLAD